MTQHRDRRLLDLAHEAPCMLQLDAPGCGNDASVPCHSDMLAHGRGMSLKSHDCFAVPGCPPCHAQFERHILGRAGYEAAWLEGHQRWLVYLFLNKLVGVLK